MAAAKRRPYTTTLLIFTCLLMSPGARAHGAEPADAKLPGGLKPDDVDFERHVMGVLGRSGCNAGACHGSFQGKGGLALSLFGYSPDKDFLALTRDGMGRRINPANPEESLMLLKATAQIPHGGGKRFAKNSWQYQVIHAWIAQGAKVKVGSGAVQSIRVEPSEHHCTKPGEEVQLKVLAEFADGTRADLTAFSDFRVQDDFVADVSSSGLVKGLRPGDTTVVVSYRGHVLSARVLIPNDVGKDFKYPKVPEVNYVDREVFAKLRKLNIVPSDLSSDTEFLRRVYLDTIGSLPPPDEIRKFVADNDANKREKKIDELLQHPLHAALWATKFSDITGNNVDVMELPAQLRAKRSKQWHDWLRKRFADNVPYDQMVKGILTATSRENLEPDKWAEATTALEEQLAKGFESDYAARETLDLFWRRGPNPNNFFPLEQMAEVTAAAFLGVRLECAQCHKHPFDRWTQTDYRAYANIFSQLKFGTSPEAKDVIDKINAERRKEAMDKGMNPNQAVLLREIYWSDTQPRRLPHPDTNRPLEPKALGGPPIEQKGDVRKALFAWMVSPDNPFFARAFVNRVWAHYFGVGIVDPADNFSVANPPSNEKLLDALARDFIESKFDIRRLEKTILMSRTYQLSATPNETNRHDKNNYSRAYVRRMMAEVVVDVLNSAMDVTENFGNDVPGGVRAIEVAPSRIQNPNLSYIFRIFGRPARSTACDCERASEPALPQTLFLMTDQNLMNKIASGRLRGLLANRDLDDDKVIEEMFLATVSRFPTDKEKKAALEHIKAKGNRQAAFVDVTWALINTREFILNH